MLVIENSPELDLLSPSKADLVVEPKDISFHDIGAGVVLIRVRIRNDGDYASAPTYLRLESAPLGAFVPWRPLAIVPVPALEPGESRVLSTKAVRPAVLTLGDFDNVPPTALLTALNSPDDPSRPVDPRLTVVQDLLLGGDRASSPGRNTTSRKTLLAPDLSEFLGRGNQHWAGNINVFIGQKAVERHMAKALRIHAGRPNLAMFVVGGTRKPDAYAFELLGLSPEWKAGLFDMTRGVSLLPPDSAAPVQKTQWVQAGPGHLLIILGTRPPADCARGAVEVHVTQKSTGKTAVVEFDLDPAAQGPGCYCA